MLHVALEAPNLKRVSWTKISFRNLSFTSMFFSAELKDKMSMQDFSDFQLLSLLYHIMKAVIMRCP